MKIIYSVFLAGAIFTFPMTASALTFKKGQVLGPDGQVYDGASSQLRERLIAEAESGGQVRRCSRRPALCRGEGHSDVRAAF